MSYLPHPSIARPCACGCGTLIYFRDHRRRDVQYLNAAHRKRAERARQTRNKKPLPRCAYCHQNEVPDVRSKYCCNACKQAAYRFRKANGAQLSF